MRRVLVACVAVGVGAAMLSSCGGGHARLELLVRSDRDGDVALYALSGTGAPRRVAGLPLGAGPVSASVDGRRLLLDGPTLQVLMSTGERVAILSRSLRLENPGDAAISPEGSRVAYRRYRRLVVERIRRGAEPAVVGRVDGSTPAWSPRGDRIAYATPYAIRVADADGRHDFRITPTFTQYPLAWSPDGRRLAFIAPVDPGAVIDDLWVVRVRRDARPVRVARNVAGPPAWSPNGRLIAFVQFVGARVAASAVVGGDGHGERLLTHPGIFGDSNPSWSPDGRYVLFVRYGRVEAVWSVGVRGGRPRRLTTFRDGNNDLVGWIRASSERRPAPQPKVMRLAHETKLEVPWPVDEVAAGPSGVAVAPVSAMDATAARPPLLSWEPGRALRRIPAADCDEPADPRVASRGVVFDCDRSGPDTLDQSLQLVTRGGGRRQFFHSVVGVGENYSGTFFNRVEASGDLVVFDTITQQTSRAGKVHVMAKRLWRLVGTKRRLLRSGAGLGDPVSIDGGRVLLQGGAAGLELVAGSGRTLLRLPLFRSHELSPYSAPRAALTGNRIAVVLGRRVVVFDATTGGRRASWPLPRGGVQLDGAADGRVALVRGNEVTVLSLATGRAADVFISRRDLRKLRQLGYFSPARVEATLGPAGLVYSYNVAAPPYGRVVFVPLAALRFR